MVVFFSSHQYEYPADPEVVIRDAAVMISYVNNQKKLHPRAVQLMRCRRQRKAKLRRTTESQMR